MATNNTHLPSCRVHRQHTGPWPVQAAPVATTLNRGCGELLIVETVTEVLTIVNLSQPFAQQLHPFQHPWCWFRDQIRGDFHDRNLEFHLG